MSLKREETLGVSDDECTSQRKQSLERIQGSVWDIIISQKSFWSSSDDIRVIGKLSSVATMFRFEVGFSHLAWNTLLFKTPSLPAKCLKQVLCMRVRASWHEGCLPYGRGGTTRVYSTHLAWQHALHHTYGDHQIMHTERVKRSRARGESQMCEEKNTMWPNYVLFRGMDKFFIDILLTTTLKGQVWKCISHKKLVCSMYRACNLYNGAHISKKLVSCYLQNLRGINLRRIRRANQVVWAVRVEDLLSKLRPYTAARLRIVQPVTLEPKNK